MCVAHCLQCATCRAAPYGSGPTSSDTSDSLGAGLMAKVNFEQRLDHQLPLELTFQDEQGETKTLGSYFGERPVLLVMAYYRCPKLCTQVLNGVLNCTNAINFVAGQEFEIVVVSFDPTDTPEKAADKRDAYTARYLRKEGRGGWHFLVGSPENVAALAEAVGFQYQYEPRSQQYAHASGIMLATPSGRLSRYFYGIDFPTRDLSLGLVEASAGRIGSPVHKILLMCFHYDPLTGRYGLAIYRLIQAGGIATVVGLLSYIAVMLRRERRANAITVAQSNQLIAS